MLKTTILPIKNSNFRPAFWGVERDLKDVMDHIENIWEGTTSTLAHQYKETDQAYLMSLDVPGVNKNTIDINIETDVILIEAKRNKTLLDVEENGPYKFNIKLQIPKMADKDKIQAFCEDGVLYLTLPKLEKAKPKKIEVIEGLKNTNWANHLTEKNEKKQIAN